MVIELMCRDDEATSITGVVCVVDLKGVLKNVLDEKSNFFVFFFQIFMIFIPFYSRLRLLRPDFI